MLVRSNFDQVLFINLLPALVVSLGGLVLAKDKGLGIVIEAIGLLWILISTPVSYYLQIRATKGQPPTALDCYRRGLPYFWRIIGFEIWYSVLLLVGLVLLIVPGLVVLNRYFLTPFYIVDQNLGLGPAMSASRADAEHAAGYIWGTVGVLVAFAILASIVSYIALIGVILSAFVALMYLFGPVLRYREVAQTDGRS